MKDIIVFIAFIILAFGIFEVVLTLKDVYQNSADQGNDSYKNLTKTDKELGI